MHICDVSFPEAMDSSETGGFSSKAVHRGSPRKMHANLHLSSDCSVGGSYYPPAVFLECGYRLLYQCRLQYGSNILCRP